MGKIYIGTSNITLPGSKKTFPEAYQDKSRLNYYSSLFNSLEINSSFYKSPLFSTYEKWALDTPKGFQFTVKISKEITHQKELGNATATIKQFMEAAKGLGSKKGCLLLQFPGKITLDYFSKVEEILAAVHKADNKKEWRKAIEFRNDSWYTGETYELLHEHKAALVLHDIAKGKISEPVAKSPFIFLRFHGPAGDYRGSYGDGFLKEKAKQIKRWARSGLDVYVYFNNTIGNAYDNARLLQSLTK